MFKEYCQKDTAIIIKHANLLFKVLKKKKKKRRTKFIVLVVEITQIMLIQAK